MTDQPNTATLEHAIRECLSPEGVAAVIAYLRAADMHRPKEPGQRAALREVKWLADRLTATSRCASIVANGIRPSARNAPRADVRGW
jgi:hypothetical protein